MWPWVKYHRNTFNCQSWLRASITTNRHKTPSAHAVNDLCKLLQRPSSVENVLRSYRRVLRASCASQLSSAHQSKLISLLGTASLPSPRPRCRYLLSDVERSALAPTSTGKTFWKALISVINNKRRMGRRLSDSDHFWWMRALLERSKPSDERSLATALPHYLVIRKHSADPEVHLPLIDSLLASKDGLYVAKGVHLLCDLLERVQFPHYRFLYTLWRHILQRPSEGSRIRIIRALCARTVQVCIPSRCQRAADHPRSANTNRILDVHDVCRSLSGSMFPFFQHPDMNPDLVDFSKTTAMTAFRTSEQWGNVQLLALYHSTDIPAKRIPHILIDSEDESVAWKIPFALGILDRLLARRTRIPKDIRQFANRILEAWNSSQNRIAFPSFHRSIVSTFFRIAGKLNDSNLLQRCFDLSQRKGLWSSTTSVQDEQEIHSLIVNFTVASLRCDKHHWRTIFQALVVVRSTRDWRQTVVNTLIRYFGVKDPALAFAIHEFAVQESIPTQDHLLLSFKQSPTPTNPVGSLRMLNEADTPKEVLPAIEPVLRHCSRRGQFLDNRISSVLLRAVQELSSNITKLTGPTRKQLLEGLCELINSRHAVHATRLFLSLYSDHSSLFPPSFIRKFVTSLLHRRYFRLATVVVRSTEISTPLHTHLRKLVHRRLISKGMHRLATKVELPQPQGIVAPVTPVLSSSLQHASFTQIKRIFSRFVYLRQPLEAEKVIASTVHRISAEEITVLCNVYLSGAVLCYKPRRHPQVRHILNIKDYLVSRYGFVGDAVTINILMKSLLRWHALDGRKIRLLFDYLIRRGYPAPAHLRKEYDVPFGSPPRDVEFPMHIPMSIPIPPHLDFERHIQPVYKMVIKAFHLRGDSAAAYIVVGILQWERAHR